MKNGDLYLRKNDHREYVVICIARSMNSLNKMWTDLEVVHKPTEPGYCAYVMSYDKFLNEFKKK